MIDCAVGFYTNQSALPHTLWNVWTTTDKGDANVLPALTYLNNPLQRCQIINVNIDFESEDRTTTQYAWNGWGVTLQVLPWW